MPLPPTLSEVTGPVNGYDAVEAGDADSSRPPGSTGLAVGERIIVTGRVLDEDGRPVPDALLKVWQANAAGRFRHRNDDHGAFLDPNFAGAGRCATDVEGRYHFLTIRPGAYPWINRPNAWRPAHVQFSLFGPT